MRIRTVPRLGWALALVAGAFAVVATIALAGPGASPGAPAGQTCYTLTVAVGSGSGTAEIVGPDSSGGCPSHQYTAGTTVTLLATPAGGYVFSNWTGTDNNGNSATTVTVNSDTTATAYFAANCYTLTTAVGTGSGTVSVISPPSSGGCPTGQYTPGYVVSIVATPAAGYTFSSWTGTDNNGNSATTVTMNGNRTATANFVANCYTLAVTVGSGSGTASIVSPASSGGCPTHQYSPGTTVTLLATPAGGYTFSHWTGTNNNGNSATTVTVNSNTTATAHFAANCYALTVTVGGGSGTASIVSPASSGGCPTHQYSPGTAVTVLATPAGGYTFSHWTGTDNNGNSATTVTMNANRTATAYFVANCYALTATVGTGNGTASIVSPASSGGCSTHQYSGGTVVTLMATAASGYTFSSWSGTDNNANSVTTVTMSTNKTVTANFTPLGSTPPPTYTPTATPQPTAAPTATNTPAPPATNTPVPPANTPTHTPVPPTPTDTPTPPPGATATPTPQPGEPTATPTNTPPDSPTATATSAPPTATPQTAGPCGDVNGDGVTNSIDASLILQKAAGIIAGLPRGEASGDVNGDGTANSVDAALILQAAAAMIAGGLNC